MVVGFVVVLPEVFEEDAPRTRIMAPVVHRKVLPSAPMNLHSTLHSFMLAGILESTSVSVSAPETDSPLPK